MSTQVKIGRKTKVELNEVLYIPASSKRGSFFALSPKGLVDFNKQIKEFGYTQIPGKVVTDIGPTWRFVHEGKSFVDIVIYEMWNNPFIPFSVEMVCTLGEALLNIIGLSAANGGVLLFTRTHRYTPENWSAMGTFLRSFTSFNADKFMEDSMDFPTTLSLGFDALLNWLHHESLLSNSISKTK